MVFVRSHRPVNCGDGCTRGGLAYYLGPSQSRPDGSTHSGTESKSSLRGTTDPCAFGKCVACVFFKRYGLTSPNDDHLMFLFAKFLVAGSQLFYGRPYDPHRYVAQDFSHDGKALQLSNFFSPVLVSITSILRCCNVYSPGSPCCQHSHNHPAHQLGSNHHHLHRRRRRQSQHSPIPLQHPFLVPIVMVVELWAPRWP